MTFPPSKEWIMRMAELERGCEVGAGTYDHPLRTACEKAPPGWICTRVPGHDGPCAAVMTQEAEQQDFERAAELANSARHPNCPDDPFDADDMAGYSIGVALARQCMRERLAVDLTPWTEHRLDCEVWDAKDDCTCGLTDALVGKEAHE